MKYTTYYLTSGTRQLYINSKVDPLCSGSLVFVDGEDIHRTFSTSDEQYTRFVACIKKAYLQKEFMELTKPFLTGGAFSLNLSQQG